MPFSLCFIGGGNMARSLIGGLLARGTTADDIIVADPFESARQAVAEQFGVRTTADNIEAVRTARTVILAVKPQEMRNVTIAIADSLAPECLIVSVAAGIKASDIRRWAKDRAVVRCMPNRPALQGSGMTALYAT